MNAEIDSLELQVQSNASQAASSLDALSGSLERIKRASSGGAGLAAVAKNLQAITTALSGINTQQIQGLNTLKTALTGLQSVNGVKISPTIGTQIAAIAAATNQVSTDGAQRVAAVAAAVAGLSGVRLSSTVGKQISDIAVAANTITPAAAQNLQMLATGLRPLANIGRINLGSFVNQLGKLPGLITSLQGANFNAFAGQMQQLAVAIGPLASRMQSVAAGFAALTPAAQRWLTASTAATASNARLGRSFSALKLTGVLYVFRRVGNIIANWITESNDYVENLNLFTVAMGEYANSAQEYAEKVNRVMGIDPSDWMRTQGVFQTLATGFGIAADRAAIMSKNLTQLSYDLASFYNLSVEDAAQKVQSGFAGELEPLNLAA